MSIRWGILATGGIAAAFTKDLATAGLTATAVGSRSLEKAQAFASKYGLANAHGSYEELVADPEVDIVYVATPHPGHVDGAILALEAGKHVLVEKPFTLNADEARRITELASRKGLLVLEAMWTRFLPHIVRLHEILDAGTLGDVRTVFADHNQNLPKDPEHRLNNPDLGGGALLDLGIYPVSFAVDVLGVPTSVKAIAAKTATGVDRQTAMVLGHEGGRQSLLHAALDTRGPNRSVVIGTLGRVEIEEGWGVAQSFTVFDEAGEVAERFETHIDGRGMQFQALEAERLIEAGEIASPRLSPAESVAIMAVLDEVRAQIGLVYPGEQPKGE
ncbi:Gfo/Idh/MocA family protein [Herbiconiux sp. L3-i23]|uniref:Gfo/Idh/MocA family protein n=1 Tax=Herbiconiux sp. L3-i23 TaxID=2905871 RepID=UPI002062611C|nr:Gfo/Idh/MocA family oxidoreductase [Herbiconiux sp. L3-i23]BDI21537.1 oxidoreductase [Herbiconiux sp. L3-i23]